MIRPINKEAISSELKRYLIPNLVNLTLSYMSTKIQPFCKIDTGMIRTRPNELTLTDTYRRYIVVLSTAPETEGHIITQWGHDGSAASTLIFPAGITQLSEEEIAVIDPVAGTVLVFANDIKSQGQLLRRWNCSHHGMSRIEKISSVEVALVCRGQMRVYICDFQGRPLRQWDTNFYTDEVIRLSSTRLMFVDRLNQQVHVTTHDGISRRWCILEFSFCGIRRPILCP